jgi:SAM-dependent methyltransferase
MAPIDWNEHWALHREPEGATQFAVEMAERVGRFIDERDVRDAADFGCGHATTLFELAGMYPSIDFFGFDIAESVIRENRERAEEGGHGNLFFEMDNLPTPKTLRRFDLVLCFSTLHYIRDIEEAIRSLFRLVNPGGHLIFNYPNVYSKKAKEKETLPDDGYSRRRFSFLLSGENMTSQRKIRRILGVYPRRFYSSKIFNVYVKVRKPRSE